MRAGLLGTLGLSLGLWAGAAKAEELTWRPVAATPPAKRTIEAGPTATFGRPVPLSNATSTESHVAPVSYSPEPAASFGPIIRAQAPDPPPPGTAPVQQVPPVNDVLAPAPIADPAGLHAPNDGNPAWLNGGWLGTYQGCAERACLQSDHCFDTFISPVTSPFLFEDPRSLTEVKPIFIWQKTPHNSTPYNGGSIEFYGIQARVAITERLSVTLNKLGGISQEVNNPTGDYATNSGFAQLELGAKYTFLRQECWGTVGAFGLTFEAPVGTKGVFQDTGTLSVRPYLSLAQNFGKSSYGSFNFMTTMGGSFALDNSRSNFIFTGLHLDYDVANWHKIYPLIELNWADYTSNGHVRNQSFEGRDLFNYGAMGVSGHNNFTIAFGGRYKFREWLQTGLAAEWAVAGKKDIQDFRLTWDVIFRY